MRVRAGTYVGASVHQQLAEGHVAGPRGSVQGALPAAVHQVHKGRVHVGQVVGRPLHVGAPTAEETRSVSGACGAPGTWVGCARGTHGCHEDATCELDALADVQWGVAASVACCRVGATTEQGDRFRDAIKGSRIVERRAAITTPPARTHNDG